MDPFVMNFDEYKYSIYESLIEIFGKEFSSLIKKRYDNICYVPYVNYVGIHSYYRFLIACKSKQLTLKFFKITGIDISKYNITNYADELPEDLKTKANNLIGGDYAFEPLFSDAPGGFKSFIPRYANDYTKDYILENKLEYINEIKRVGTPTITLDNYDEFTTTDEYKRIESMAFFCHGIYSALLIEMDEFISKIKHYDEYYKKEIQRKRNIEEKKRIKLFRVLEDGLRGKIKAHIDSLDSIEHKATDLLSNNIEFTSNIEYFNDEYEAKLKDPNVDDSTKAYIKLMRMNFFHTMGAKVNPREDNYDEIIKRDDIKEYIVYSVFANEITRLRKYYLDEATKDHILEGEAFTNAMQPFKNDEHNREVVFNIMYKLQVCTNTGSNEKCDFNSIIYYTIREWQCGCMDYVLIHEIIHAIETTQSKDKKDHNCGFEQNIDNPEMSSYNHKEPKRKYERLNETITDILAIEVTNHLHSKGIYFLDTKETALTNFDNFNTRRIVKNAVYRFYKTYRKHIIEARLNGDMTYLTNYIGIDNYEEFNDIIDHIDYLVEQGLEKKLEEQNLDDDIVIEYHELLKQLDIVYKNMEDTYNTGQDPYNPYNPFSYKKRRKGK
jgi:hypothetical protein